MTFKEFTKAIKKDPRLMELLDKCDRSCGPMSDEETQELIDRTELACMAFSDEYQPEDFLPDDYNNNYLDDLSTYKDPIWNESENDSSESWWE